jgi:hypothetical protein
MPSTYIYGSASPKPKQTVGTTRQTLLGSGNDVAAHEVWITADDANSGKIFIGDVTVTNTGGGNVFTKLQAGGGIVMQIGNTNELYAVGTASGQVYYVGVL